jgi:hypothetical protein
MRFPASATFVLLLVVLFSCSNRADVVLNVRTTSEGLELSWEPENAGLDGPAELRVESSEDLANWQFQSRHILPKGQTEAWRLQLGSDVAKRFFRVQSSFKVELVRAEGADALGYGDLFKQELEQIGQISTAQFAALYPDQQDYLGSLSWNPASAKFFTEFNTAPGDARRDFSLNPVELAVFKTNGFVVSTRIAQTNFTDLYYDIFVRDLPVFVTADSVLHAWYKSAETILEYLEELYLANGLKEVLKGMADELPNIAPEIGEGALKQSLLDADYYLAVARALAEKSAPTYFGQDELVGQTLAFIYDGQYRLFDIFGRTGFHFDFSEFTVRSHYTHSPALASYFRAMMWCGRVDFRIAGNPDESSPRELGTALILHEAMVRSGKLPLWSAMDGAIRRLIGANDSMDFTQMSQIVQKAKLNSLADIQSLDDLIRIKTAIEQGSYGVQEILSDTYYSPFGPKQVWLPRSFAVFGQRFTMDAWALGKVVFDQILWRKSAAEEPEKVIRRRASGLDTAFAVLQNNVAGPEIVKRIENAEGVPFRDGLPYQHNLAATRSVIDAQDEGAWHSSMYGDWLFTLRTLSEPMTEERFPEAMRTRAWALRRLNTQLASWAELRHTTALYVKQTYVPIYLCSYPAGFVEPNPGFWGGLQMMVENVKACVEKLPLSGTALWQGRVGTAPWPTTSLDLAVIKQGQLVFLNRFAANAATLKTLAEKELKQEPFTVEETSFVENLVELPQFYGTRRYTGWYPLLYYGAQEGYDSFSASLSGPDGTRAEYIPDYRKSIALVTDVLTAPPDPVVGDPGAVQHQGVGNVFFMMLAVDNGPDRMVYGGPVFSHYEFDVPGVRRLTDAEWQSQLDAGTEPERPDWTSSWMIGR